MNEEQVYLQWLTVPEYNLIDKKIVNCNVVSYPLPNETGTYIIGVYFYPEKKKRTTSSIG